MASIDFRTGKISKSPIKEPTRPSRIYTSGKTTTKKPKPPAGVSPTRRPTTPKPVPTGRKPKTSASLGPKASTRRTAPSNTSRPTRPVFRRGR